MRKIEEGLYFGGKRLQIWLIQWDSNLESQRFSWFFVDRMVVAALSIIFSMTNSEVRVSQCLFSTFEGILSLKPSNGLSLLSRWEGCVTCELAASRNGITITLLA